MMKELIKSTTMPTVRMTHLSSEQRELLPLAFGEFPRHGSNRNLSRNLLQHAC